jgi:hypothetical protein
MTSTQGEKGKKEGRPHTSDPRTAATATSTSMRRQDLIGAALPVACSGWEKTLPDARWRALRVAVDLHPGAFDKWLAEVAPVDPKEAAAEAAKISRDVLAQSATALPFGERMNLIDQLLAANVADVKAA